MYFSNQLPVVSCQLPAIAPRRARRTGPALAKIGLERGTHVGWIVTQATRRAAGLENDIHRRHGEHGEELGKNQKRLKSKAKQPRIYTDQHGYGLGLEAKATAGYADIFSA
jgi:hypothetical protein